MASPYQICLIGGGGAGKMHGVFFGYTDTTMEPVYTQRFMIDEQSCLLDVVATGDESYLGAGEGFLCVYSITSRVSFEKVAVFRDHILRANDVDAVPMVICGNMCDLEWEREVSTAEGEQLAKQFSVPFFETSAKTGVNVREAFFQLVREIRAYGRNLRRPRRPTEPKKECSLM